MTHSFSQADQLVFRTVKMDQPLHQRVVDHALRYRSVFAGCADLSTQDIEVAVRKLLDSNIIQLVDLKAIADIETYLGQQECTWPIFGLPQLGSLDVTASGTERWKDAFTPSEDPLNQHWSVVLERLIAFYGRTENAIRRVLAAASITGSESLCGPTPIGEWTLVSWETNPHGHVVYVSKHNPNLVAQRRPILTNTHCHQDLGHYLFEDFARMLLAWLQFDGRARDTGSSSAEEAVCLALVSGAFGCRNLSREGVNERLRPILREVFGTAMSQPNSLVGRLMQMGLIGVAKVNDEERLDTKSPDVIRLVRRSIPGVTIILKPDGVRELRSLQNRTGCKWDDYVVGESEVEETRLEYFLTRSDAASAANRIREQSAACIASDVEPIGRWCANWWDIKPFGFRMRVNSLFG